MACSLPELYMLSLCEQEIVCVNHKKSFYVCTCELTMCWCSVPTDGPPTYAQLQCGQSHSDVNNEASPVLYQPSSVEVASVEQQRVSYQPNAWFRK